MKKAIFFVMAVVCLTISTGLNQHADVTETAEFVLPDPRTGIVKFDV